MGELAAVAIAFISNCKGSDELHDRCNDRELLLKYNPQKMFNRWLNPSKIVPEGHFEFVAEALAEAKAKAKGDAEATAELEKFEKEVEESKKTAVPMDQVW